LYKFIFLILAIFTTPLLAQFENTDIGARSVGLNGAFTSVGNDAFSIFYNPSGLGQLKYRELGVFYSPAPFGLSELATGALVYAEPTSFGTFGLGLKTYGFELYRENNIIVSYGRDFKNRIFYGVNLNVYNLNIKNYNSATTFGVDLGAMAYLTEFLRWGFFGRNITGSRIADSEEKIAQVFRTGFNIIPREDLSLSLEAEKDVRYPLSIRAGLEYSLYDYIDLRAGVGSQPASFTGGIGIKYDLIQLDYAIYNHQDLGITHQGTISVNFGGNDARKFSREQLKNAFK
jgi:hypothetical protein